MFSGAARRPVFLMDEITTLLVGDCERAEFREARETMRAESVVVAVPDMDRAARALASGDLVPEVIVIAQARPGAFTADQVDRLLHLAPLARVLGLLGSWCEGEVRTGHPWPGVVRVYWYDWLPRWKQALEKVRKGECPAWGLPVTASDRDRLLQALETSPESRQGSIAVCTSFLETYEALSDACRMRGYSTVWVRPGSAGFRVEGVTAAIWDAVEGNPHEIDELRRLCDALGRPPVVALMDFPRIDACGRVIAAGASCVVAKPYLLDDLFDRLDHILSREAEPERMDRQSPSLMPGAEEAA